MVADEAGPAQGIHNEFRVDGIAVDDENVARGHALRLLSLLQVECPPAQMLHTEISGTKTFSLLGHDSVCVFCT